MKAALEERVESIDLEQSWARKETSPSITEIADQNIIKMTVIESEKNITKLYNPYQGNLAGRQLEETVDQFLKRLPPATSKVSLNLPWIFIANPFRPRPRSSSGTHDPDVDGPPPDDGTNLSQFCVLGRNLLEELVDDVADIARDFSGQVSARRFACRVLKGLS